MTQFIRSYATIMATSSSYGGVPMTVPVPFGTQNGDLMVALIDPLLAKTVIGLSAWTNQTGSPGSNGFIIGQSSKVASSEPGGGYPCTVGGTTANGFPTAVVSLGNAATIDAVQGTSASSSTAPAAAGITTTVNNEIVLAAFAYPNNSAFTPPAGYSVLTTVVSTLMTNTTLAVCYALKATAGATGTLTAGLGTAAACECLVVAYKPSATTPQFWTAYVKCAEADQ